jgi:putative SOS response-associated peptidase YedK
MTRTWYSLAGAELFAVAGIWRATHEWGDAYSMVMVDGCAQMADVHDRMPVVLAPDDWSRWLAAEPDEAFALCRPCPYPLTVERTDQAWVRSRGT